MNSAIESAKEMTLEQTRHLDIAMDFIPAEKQQWSPGGCAKTPLQIYSECIGVYMWSARYFRGEEDLDWEAVIAEFQKATGYGEAKVLMEKALQDLLAALDAIDPARLDEIVEPGFGMQMPLGQYILLPAYHTCYHAGQLNYMQTLLGDAEMHF